MLEFLDVPMNELDGLAIHVDLVDLDLRPVPGDEFLDLVGNAKRI